MSYIFKMPAVGEGISEGEIVKWDVEVGDSIKEDATLIEIQNDKLVQEVPSPVTGTITKLLVEAGTVAKVGDPLAEIDAPGYENSEEESSEADKVEVEEETKEETIQQAKSPTEEEPIESSNYIFELPKVGEGIAEGEIVEWNVEVGDSINVDETLLEVQNDKMVQEVPSPVTGIIRKIIVEAGTVAQIGEPIAEIEVEGHVSDVKKQATQEVVKDDTVKKDKEEKTTTTKEAQSSVVAGRVLAMPSVRQYARDMDIEITKISGTGGHGHITKDDVDKFISEPAKETQTQAVSETTKTKESSKKVALEAHSVKETDNTTREKMTPIRRAISQAMLNSKAHAPHVTIFDEVEVSKLMDHRKKFKEVAAKQDISLTFLAYMTKAVVTVLRRYPILNASVDEATDEIVYKNYYNMGIAVDTERGLYVPNIKDADRKGIFTVADEIKKLADKAHAGELSATEMSNGSTSISNIGSAWGMWFTPIINYPEVAIFGMGRIEKKPIVLEDDTIAVGSVLHLSMSFDHRIVDGAVAQNAMNELKRLISDPELLMMEG